MQLEVESAKNDMRQQYLQSLKDLKVDMTAYLTAVQPQFVPEQEIIVGPPENSVPRNPPKF